MLGEWSSNVLGAPQPPAAAGWTLLQFRRTGVKTEFEAYAGQYRLVIRQPDDESHPTLWDSSITLSQRGSVTIGSGAVRRYGAWYRNASTTFCPPATANVSNGWIITW